MSRARWLPLSCVGLAALLLAVVLAQSSRHESAPPGPSPSEIENDPLLISASQTGRFAEGWSWNLLVDSAGAAVLKIDSFPNSKERKFKISKDQIDRFRKALAHEKFFDLADEYGDHVFDSSTTTMTISLGGTKKTVVLTYLMNWVRSDPAKLKEPSRAIRVLHVIRGWFDDPEAVDLRKYERMEAVAASLSE